MTTTADPSAEAASLRARLEAALRARADALEADPRREAALRLFNGHLEGWPGLVVDRYGRSLVLHWHGRAEGAGEHRAAGELQTEGTQAAQDPDGLDPAAPTPWATALAFYREALPWLEAVLLKERRADDAAERHGRLLFGDRPQDWVREAGLRYALDLDGGHDCGLYLDTRRLRAWLRAHLAGARVLNCFAYTGSLGLAALAGGAAQVLQLDRSRAALNLAKRSYTLNGLPIHRPDFFQADFWDACARLRRQEQRFDAVILDPPHLTQGPRGRADLADGGLALINKVRPLVADGGRLVVVNNALYLSGRAFMDTLDRVCADGYLELAETIGVDEDCRGYGATLVPGDLPDPAPFAHSSKIAVLAVRRKDGRGAENR